MVRWLASIYNNAYIKGRIIEYDIASANISVCAEKRLITEDEHKMLNRMDKDKRNVSFGCMIRDNPLLGQRYREELSKQMDLFIEVNDIDKYSLLEIASDAIWVVNKACKQLSFGEYIRYRNKREYTSLLILDKKHYYFNSVLGDMEFRFLDEKHKDDEIFIEYVKTVMSLKEINDDKSIYLKTHEMILTEYRNNLIMIRQLRAILDIMNI